MERLRRLWSLVLELTGDSDYARYCRSMRVREPDRPLPTEREFYLARLDEKYARPNRCC